MTEEERQKKILAIQAPSMQKIMLRPESEDAAWWGRPFPENWKARPDAQTMEEAVGTRLLTYQEAKIEQAMRNHRGQSMGAIHAAAYEKALASGVKIPAHMVDDLPSSVNPAKKERGIFAFLRVKFKDIMKWSGLDKPKESLIERVRREARIEE